tara:strand:- start:11466 stop:12056 length:591 start_codon:yes stop_codon:yes gene_type:complete
MNIDLLGFILICLIVILSYRIYRDSDLFHLKCIISNIDGNTYCVRERSKLELAADKLAKVNQNMKSLVEHCKNNFDSEERIKRLTEGFNPKKITETLPTSEFTAYSENKGEKIAFCLDTEKNNKGRLIDLNTLTFVAIHELSHVATKTVGHTPEFWANFKFLLQEAEKINIYKPVDYSKNPKKYCGMEINDNPYFS